MCFFFKQKTAYEMRISDWSSDVCSSDLLTGGAGDEGHRNEYGEQHQRDGHDRGGDLAHRLARRLLHRQTRLLLRHPLAVIDHADGVVDDDADREHEGEKRDRVRPVADDQNPGEGAEYLHGYTVPWYNRRLQRASANEQH